MAGPVTLSQVAREAGVSLATASRAINGSANRTVRDDLRERVLAAAERLHYVPDANAQAMARGRTSSLGLIVHDIADPYFSSIAAGVAQAAGAAGLAVTLASTQHDAGLEPRFVQLLTRQRARAIVVAGGCLADDEANVRMHDALVDFRASGGTVALIGPPLPCVDSVVIAHRGGSADLARSLHGRGYRRFAVLAGPRDHHTARDRDAGFREALAALGSPVDPGVVVPSAFTRDGGYEAMRTVLGSRADVQCVFAVNDVMAAGAIAAARDLRVRVPDDVAVAGFDDLVILRDLTPALSTVHVPLVDVGVRATELALSEAEAEPRAVAVQGEVVLRESTPGPR